MKSYDIIIVGAGPVGISIAVKLNKKYRTLIIDKRKIPYIGKTLAVPKKWLKKAGFEKYIEHEITSIGLYSYLDDEYFTNQLPERYFGAVLKSKLFFNDSITKLKKKNFQILENTEIVKYKHRNDSVIIASNKKDHFNAKLIIDCSGIDSIFNKDNNNSQSNLYYTVYGKRYSKSKLSTQCTYIPAFIKQDEIGNNILVNYLPENEKTCLLWSMILDKRRYDIIHMRKLYKDIKQSKFWNNNFFKSRELGEQYGIIPMRESKTNIQDNILSLGDAGAYSPWANGMTFSVTIQKLSEIIRGIENSIDTGKLLSHDLDRIFHYTKEEKLNYEFNKLLYIYAMNSSPEDLTKIIDLFSNKNMLHFLKIMVYLDESLEELLKITLAIIKKISLKNFLEIIGKDGYDEELQFIKNVILNRLDK